MSHYGQGWTHSTLDTIWSSIIWLNLMYWYKHNLKVDVFIDQASPYDNVKSCPWGPYWSVVKFSFLDVYPSKSNILLICFLQYNRLLEITRIHTILVFNITVWQSTTSVRSDMQWYLLRYVEQFTVVLQNNHVMQQFQKSWYRVYTTAKDGCAYCW